MSAMDEMLANMLKKALPKDALENINKVAAQVSQFIVNASAQLDRIEARLERLENDDSGNSTGIGNDEGIGGINLSIGSIGNPSGSA